MIKMKIKYPLIIILSLMMSAGANDITQWIFNMLFSFTIILVVLNGLHLIKNKFCKGGELTNGS